MSALSPDYRKRDCSLPPGCKDLIDVLRRDQAQQKLVDSPKWQAVSDRYGSYILRAAQKAGLTGKEAQEVVLEVFLDLANQLPEFTSAHSWHVSRAQMLSLARWRIIRRLRDKRRES